MEADEVHDEADHTTIADLPAQLETDREMQSRVNLYKDGDHVDDEDEEGVRLEERADGSRGDSGCRGLKCWRWWCRGSGLGFGRSFLTALVSVGHVYPLAVASFFSPQLAYVYSGHGGVGGFERPAGQPGPEADSKPGGSP